MSAPYRILSLDGGGSWALIQVRCLQQLMPWATTGHQVLRCFDLVAANSGGSIVLAGLVADMPLADILALFENEAVRRDIFAPTDKLGWRLEHALAEASGDWLPAVGPRYSTERKLAALRQHLGVLNGLCLHNVPDRVSQPGSGRPGPHVLIPAFDYNRQRSTFFRSDQLSRGDSAVLADVLASRPPAPATGHPVELLAAVHASSTAPVNFFDATAAVSIGGQDSYLWDGGVAGYNNPVLAAVTEALSNGHPAASIQVVSVGTGAKVFPVAQAGQTAEYDSLLTAAKANEGFFRDVVKVASAIVGAPPDSASYVAFTTLNPNFAHAGFQSRNFIRANPVVQPRLENNTWHAPPSYDETTIKAICALELDAVTNEEVKLVQRICEDWLAGRLPNQPVRADAELRCLVGQPLFADVQRLFNELFPFAS
ncbi:patatin-like phospholipase family protein [Hymenobacter cheonanensis]|uniref:patatin-like phospholipase family protein n=1 Tax=Hymenobacter sp. CA2-7 TaxID=3063993 RepID=UPI002713243D|nr:patatin-like phospholipase family protein [Hymenobacter sp. CA2-7]MDO7886641.1 patatin-like phospholipase family protein [Hymenobacter sp. CA2-7]